MIKLGLDTESLHLWFQNKRMDIFGFIEKAHELGFDGVMINILKDYNLDPEWGTLMSNDPAHLKKVRDLLETYHMYAELATKGITKEHLLKVLDVAEALGADIIRHLHSDHLKSTRLTCYWRRRKIRPGKSTRRF